MNWTQFNRILDLVCIKPGSDLSLPEVREAVWSLVLGKAPREERKCLECGEGFYPGRADQLYCPGGKCSSRRRQRAYKERQGL